MEVSFASKVGPKVLCSLWYGRTASASILHGVPGLAGGDDTEKKQRPFWHHQSCPKSPVTHTVWAFAESACWTGSSCMKFTCFTFTRRELQRGVPPPYGENFSKETLIRSASSKALAATTEARIGKQCCCVHTLMQIFMPFCLQVWTAIHWGMAFQLRPLMRMRLKGYLMHASDIQIIGVDSKLQQWYYWGQAWVSEVGCFVCCCMKITMDCLCACQQLTVWCLRRRPHGRKA